MGAKCQVPENVAYDGVMQLASVKCSSTDPLLQKHSPNSSLSPSWEERGRLPGSGAPPSHAQTPTIKATQPLAAQTPTTVAAETQSLPGIMTHSRKQSIGNASLKTNGSTKNGDSLSRSTSTMSSGSIASNISQLCEKYFMQPLSRTRSLPTNMGGTSAGGSLSSRLIPYIHMRRRKGKCMQKFCMRFLPPAAACSGAVAWQLNIIADRNLGKVSPGKGSRKVYPLGFSKGNKGSERGLGSKLQHLREPIAVDEEPFNFFICHTEEDYIPFVAELVKRCDKEGITVFSRSYSLLWGDSQRQDTECAISSAMFGIVLLSPSLLSSYRNAWCEKDLDVLFDRSTAYTSYHSLILPIYCGGVTHHQVQLKYPFLATQTKIVFEELKVDGIVKQMKLVLEKRKQKAKTYKQSIYNVEKDQSAKAVSQLEVVCEMKPEEVQGVVCTRPNTLQLIGGEDSSTNSPTTHSTTASTPSKLSSLRSASSAGRKAKKTLRIDPHPKFEKASPLYRTDGVTNHCCHCGPMSSKYQGSVPCTQLHDSEAAMMEQLHQTWISDEAETATQASEELDQMLRDPGKLNELLPIPLSQLPHHTMRQLCFLMDPMVAVGADFTAFAAKIGFCTTYIRYLKALDIKKNSPFEEVLSVWQDSAPDTTIGDLLYLLNDIQRMDAVEKLKETYSIE